MGTERCNNCMAAGVGLEVCPHCGYDNSRQNGEHQLPAGTVLNGQYVVGRVLGQGGFGITYKGWDSFLEIPVAIKEYFPTSFVTRICTQSHEVRSYGGDAEARFEHNKRRFQREVRALARFTEVKEIVQVRNFFYANNTAYIVMEYVDGVDIRGYMIQRGGRLSMEETKRLLGPIVRAVALVHREGLVHRDISPDNIMLTPDGSVKLLDFGAVRDMGAEAGTAASTEAILKQGFAPIEQYVSTGRIGPWTDVYALCATMYYCVTGRIPPDAASRTMGEALPWFRELGLSVSPADESAVRRGMELQPENRLQNMGQLRDALYGAAGHRPPTTEQRIPPPAKKRGIGRAGRVLLAVGAALGLLIALAAGEIFGLTHVTESIAEKGSVTAQRLVGDAYHEGMGRERDAAAAVSWWEKAAEQGDVHSQSQLGWAYSNGIGVETDYDSAFQWLSKASGQGDAAATANLGWLYYSGLGVEMDDGKAEECFLSAAGKGNVFAQMMLGHLYSDGYGEDDYDKAFEWTSKAAEQGDTDATANLGWHYYNGYGVKEDEGKAIKYLTAAAEEGSAFAQMLLGHLYADGRGEDDHDKAFQWTSKAAEQGDAAAMANLGWHYYYGLGVKQDYGKALDCLDRAARKGNSFAYEMLGRAYSGGNGTEQDFTTAIKCFSEAAGDGDWSALMLESTETAMSFLLGEWNNGAGTWMEFEPSQEAGVYTAIWSIEGVGNATWDIAMGELLLFDETGYETRAALLTVIDENTLSVSVRGTGESYTLTRQ